MNKHILSYYNFQRKSYIACIHLYWAEILTYSVASVQYEFSHPLAQYNPKILRNIMLKNYINDILLIGSDKEIVTRDLGKTFISQRVGGKLYEDSGTTSVKTLGVYGSGECHNSPPKRKTNSGILLPLPQSRKHIS